jgi:DNA-binding beta-propeller fold protein YncE
MMGGSMMKKPICISVAGLFILSFIGYAVAQTDSNLMSLDFPEGITVDTDGNVYVADTNNNRIQKFDSDGNFLAKWGSLGTNDREFSLPEGIAVDADGNVYVADTNNNRIQKFDGMGNTIALSEGGMEETVEKVTVEYQDSTFDVPLSLSNGSVVSIEVDPDFTSVILTLEPGEEDGKLSITLPRALIDSKMDGSDDMFVVLADGDDVEYEETDTTDTERVLTIPVSAGVSEIEIVGTQVVPEFPLGMIILMGSITIAMVIMRLNGRLKFNW